VTELRLILRLLLVQALWNYRTLLGAGLAWVLAPSLRELAGREEDRFKEAFRRHAEHFNAHPYLAGVAAGSLARLERDGEGEETFRRFRDALRGPLGSLGDGLIWAAWLPACVLASGVAGLAGAPPLWAVVGFLVAYNLLHLTLRWWGVSIGLAFGKGVGAPLARSGLQRWAERVGWVGVLLLGLLAGVTFGRGFAASGLPTSADVVGTATILGLLLFGLGLWRGRAAWGWTPVMLPVAILGVLVVGAFA
jgi:mannose PTS system EIID component